MMANSSDNLRQIIAAAKRNDPQAFDSLLDMYAARLYGYFLRMTGSPDDAKDLLGDMSLKLVRSISKYNERGRFESWLFTLAGNLLRDRIRKIKAAPKFVSISSNTNDGESESQLEQLQGQDQSPEEKLQQAERSELLHRALDELDEKTREIIMMRHFSQMSFAEIAAEKEIPLGTVLARVHRGLKKLKDKLETAL